MKCWTKEYFFCINSGMELKLEIYQVLAFVPVWDVVTQDPRTVVMFDFLRCREIKISTDNLLFET